MLEYILAATMVGGFEFSNSLSSLVLVKRPADRAEVVIWQYMQQSESKLDVLWA